GHSFLHVRMYEIGQSVSIGRSMVFTKRANQVRRSAGSYGNVLGHISRLDRAAQQPRVLVVVVVGLLVLARLDIVPEVGGRRSVGVEHAAQELVAAIVRQVDDGVDVIVGREMCGEEAAGGAADRTLDRVSVGIGSVNRKYTSNRTLPRRNRRSVPASNRVPHA